MTYFRVILLERALQCQLLVSAGTGSSPVLLVGAVATGSTVTPFGASTDVTTASLSDFALELTIMISSGSRAGRRLE